MLLSWVQVQLSLRGLSAERGGQTAVGPSPLGHSRTVCKMRLPDLSYEGEVSRVSLSAWNKHLRGVFSSSLTKVGEKSSPQSGSYVCMHWGQCSPPRGKYPEQLFAKSFTSQFMKPFTGPSLQILPGFTAFLRQAWWPVAICTFFSQAAKVPSWFWQ